MYKFDYIPEKRLSSVDEMFSVISSDLITRDHQFGFRGHRDPSWKLETTLARFMERINKSHGAKQHNKNDLLKLTIKNLEKNFKKNLIVNNDLPQNKVETIDIWQYGQHFGLPTPLLDWTYSPFVALFFALEHQDIDVASTDRCLWVIDLDIISRLNEEIIGKIRPKFKDKVLGESDMSIVFPTVDVVSDVDESNKRMPFQQGFFTKQNFSYSLEFWLSLITPELHFNQVDRHVVKKYLFPCNESDRLKMMDKLDR